MKVKNISYPYPVLGNEDDVAGEFNPTFSHIQGKDTVTLNVKFLLSNSTLEQLIKEKKAAFFVEIECNGTFYRATLSSYDYENNFVISAEKVRDRVVVKFFIRAVQDLPGYKIAGCSSDYADLSFDISQGDVLAVGGLSAFIAEKGFDPMRPIVSSFIVVKEGREKEGPIIPDFSNNERIIIKLSKKDWEKYRILKNRTWIYPLIHACIVFPVLAEALRRMNEGDEDIENTRWYGRLKTIMEQRGLPEEDPFHSAQEILRNPLDRSLTQLELSDQMESSVE